jgi:RND family efflux transporter MFP subunit
MESNLKGFLFAGLLSVSFLSVAGDAVPVTVKPYGQLAIYPVVKVPASVVSLNDSKISSEVSAVVKKIPVNVGQVVEHGSVLFELDAGHYQLEYKRSRAVMQSIEAKLDLAKYQLQRAISLSKQKVVSEELLKQRQSEVKALKAEVAAQKSAIDIAKRNLDRCTVRAPFKAVIKQRMAHVGELASIGTPLVHIIDAEHLEISAKIQTNDIASLKLADQLELVSQGNSYKLKVENITPAYDSFERSQEVRFVFLGAPALPGAFGKVQWKKTSPHMPADLVVRRRGELGVFVVNKNKAQFVGLADAKEGQPVKLTQISETTAVIVDGRYKLQDGSDVKLQ